jgi:hypothetical protein
LRSARRDTSAATPVGADEPGRVSRRRACVHNGADDGTDKNGDTGVAAELDLPHQYAATRGVDLQRRQRVAAGSTLRLLL